MNSPTDPQPNHADLPERVARLETTCEYILAELRGLRSDMQAMQHALHSEMREIQNQTRIEMRELQNQTRIEMRELQNQTRIEMREFQNEMRSEIRDVRRSAVADFRILFGALIGVAIGLAGTMARAFGWI